MACKITSKKETCFVMEQVFSCLLFKEFSDFAEQDVVGFLI